MQSIRLAVAMTIALLAGAILFAQGPRRDVGNNVPLPDVPSASIPKDAVRAEPVSIDVDLVPIDVVVADKNGSLIRGLEKKDFKVFDRSEERRVGKECRSR